MEKYFICFNFTYRARKYPGISVENNRSEIFNIIMPDSVDELKEIIIKDKERWFKFGPLIGK